MFSMIVAFDTNKLIGKDNKIPWYYPEDLKYFKEITWGKIVVMGSKTYESIINRLNKPLPNRHSIVITRKKEKYPEVETYSSIECFINKYRNTNEEIFIIGGKQIYQQLIDYASKLYITHINEEYIGDTYFPDYNQADFKLISEKTNNKLRFAVYERRS